MSDSMFGKEKDNTVEKTTSSKSKDKKITIVYADATSSDILKLVKVTGRFKNKLELCRLAEKQGTAVVYPDSVLRNIKNTREE